MTLEQWLSDKIKEKGIKQRFIAEKTGISEQKLSFSLTGRRNLLAEELLAICYVADINPFEYPPLKEISKANA